MRGVRDRHSCLNNNDETQVYNTCEQHHKLEDIICLDCKSFVCYICALFDKHKGHRVKSKQEVLEHSHKI